MEFSKAELGLINEIIDSNLGMEKEDADPDMTPEQHKKYITNLSSILKKTTGFTADELKIIENVFTQNIEIELEEPDEDMSSVEHKKYIALLTSVVSKSKLMA